MSGIKDTTEAWTKVWMDAQKQYLDAWMRLSGEARNWPDTRATVCLGERQPLERAPAAMVQTDNAGPAPGQPGHRHPAV